MNKRIKELLAKATSHQTLSSGVKYDFTVDQEKFAELIIQECIEILNKEVYLATREDGEQVHLDVVLLEHFGIEE